MCFFLVRPPDQPSVTVTAISSNSISLSWSVPSDTVVTSSEVSWTESESNSTYTSGSIAVSSYTLTELQENTIYSVVVRVTNVAGSRTNQIAITTTEKGIHLPFLLPLHHYHSALMQFTFSNVQQTQMMMIELSSYS